MNAGRYFAGLLLAGTCVAAMSGAVDEQDVPPDNFLPQGNVRTSHAGVIRIYKVNAEGKIGPQPTGFPKTVNDPTQPFEMADDEVPRIHEGFDFSSRGKDGKPIPTEFRAGVYGKIAEPPRKGIIVVEVDDGGNRVEYLHNSAVANGIVKGLKVNPLTVLGTTGNYSPSLNMQGQPFPLNGMAIHLHVQARNKSGQALYPDEVIRYAHIASALRGKKAGFFVPMKWMDLKKLKPIDWNEVQQDFVDRGRPGIGGVSTPRLVFDENVPKKKN